MALVQVFVEHEMSLATIKTKLGYRYEPEAAVFQSLPEGWKRESRETGRRRPQVLFVRVVEITSAETRNGKQKDVCATRVELEEEVEKEYTLRAKKTKNKAPWLGQAAGGRWEVSICFGETKARAA